MTVPQLLEQLKTEEKTPNKTTIYRQLEKLKEHNIIHEVLVKNGITYYEYQSSHHHHFICNQCSGITCMESDELERSIHHVEDQLNKKSFQITHHEFNLYGTCNSCTPIVPKGVPA